MFLCYGRHTNLELLVHYGFVLPDTAASGPANPHDTAVLPLQLLPPEAASKLPGPEEECCYIHANGTPAWELLRALRLAGATPAERRSTAYLALQDQPISEGSETRALGMLRDACAAALHALPTTAQQDEALLAGAVGGSQQAGRQQAGTDQANGSREQASISSLQAEKSSSSSGGIEQATAALSDCGRLAVEWRLGQKR